MGIARRQSTADEGTMIVQSVQSTPPERGAGNADDAALVRRIVRRDEAALASLYERYGVVVFSLCARVVQDRPTAEELTQDVFLRVWTGAASYDASRGQVSTWLARIARNLALNELRRRRRRPVVAPDVDWERAGASLDHPSREGDPARCACEGEFAALQWALNRLPAPQREAIELAVLGGLTQAEIAAIQGVPLGTVKGRLRAGMRHLREALAAVGIDAPHEVAA